MARFETIDDDLLRRLPLPLAKLYRRAHNAKTPFDRHQTAYFLWEASLKLLGSAAIAAYAEHPQHDPQIAETLKKLARPSLGHWWEFVRIVVPVLAEAGDEGFQAVRATVLDRSRQDLPMVAALDFELCEALGIGAGTKNNVRVSELFDRLVHYRNREVGHGAAGQRAADFYGRMGRVLLSGTAELLARLDVLAGRRLIYIDEVRLQKTGHYLIERYALAGEAARRVESLERPAAEASRLPRPEQLYLEMAPPDAAEANPRLALTSLRPLLVYEATVDEILFLNARKNRQKCEYLCYTTGDHAERAELEGEQRALLARILGGAVEGVTFANWQAESQAGDEPAEAVPEGLARPLRRIGEFELLSELGHGNMGKVYRAWQPSLGRQVALKCISKADDAKARARFYREIHALGRVDHPHLVKIYTSGFEEEPCFYTMELVEGATLAAVCDTLHSRSSTAAGLDLDTWQASLSTACEESRKAEKALSEPGTEEAPPTALAGARSSAPGSDQAPADRTYVRQIVDLMRQVSLAAHALHEAGVVHRDIKPGNIMITADGTQAVLMDLGLAQLADDVDGKLTRTRQFVGTLRYASPEQVLAVGGIDRRSDIYSLGVSLWELLTLRPMYGATDEMPTPELMRRITSGDGERVRKFHPGIAADLEAIVHKCLEKDPTRRYATAAELAEDLSRWQRGELVTAQPLTMRYVAGKFVRRHRWPIGAAAVALVLAGAGLTDEYLRINRANLNLSAAVQEARQEREKANRARHEAEADRNLAEAERNNALHASERAKQAQADAEAQRDEARTQHAEADRQKQRAEIQERLAKQGEEEASRNFYTAQMHLAERAWEDENIARVVDLLETLWHGQDETDPRGFEWYFLWGLCNNVPEIARGHSKQVSAIAVSPDGQGMFTAGMDGTLKAWNLGPLPGQWRLAERIVSQSHFNLAMLGVAYSPDGKFVAFSVNSGAVALLHSVAKDGPPRILNHSMGAARALGVAFAPDGKVLASSGEDGTVKLWNTQTGELIRTIDTRRFGIGARLVVQDSKIVIQAVIPGGSAARDGRLKERDRILGIATGAEGTLEPADGKSIGEMVALVRGKAGTEVELEVEPADGSERTHYKLKREPIGIENLAVRSVAFAADGKTLAVGSTDGTIRLCDPATGDELATLAEHSDFVNVVAFAPDSQTLASCSADGSAMIWDVATRHRKYTLLGHVGAVLSLAFSPDGKTLATGAQDRTAKVWDPATGRQKGFPLGHTGMVTALAFTRDSQKLISGSSDGTVRIWNLGLERVRRAQGQHNSAVTSLVFASDGAWFATSGGDREVKLWDPMSGREKASLRGHVGQVRGLAIAPNNKTIATGSADASVKLWGAEGGEARLTLEGHQSEVSAVAFSPDGSMLASGSFDRSLRLWNPETGKLVRTLPDRTAGNAVPIEDRINTLAFSPDGRLVVAGGENGTIRAWDPATGDERASISDQLYPVDKMMFTPDSKFLVVGTRDGTVTFLSSSTWKFETVLTGHRDQIAFITISKDATRLFTGSRDGSVRIWQLPTRMEVVAFHTAGFKLGAGAYDPSGRGLVLGALNGQILFWSKASELDVGRYHIEVEEWSRAVADLSKAIAQGIDTSEVRFRRGVAFASLSRWKAAQDDLKRVHEATPADVIVGLTDAVLSLHLGDSASYRAVCADLVEAHEGNVDLFTTSAITWACVVGPGALDDPEKAVVQGRRAFAAQTGGYNLYSATGLGAALYRAGKFEEALAQLKRAVALHGTGTAYEWLFLAMTEHQLGHDKEAQEWYKKAADWVEQAKQQKVQDAFLNVPLSWMNTLSLELLLNEYGTMSKK